MLIFNCTWRIRYVKYEIALRLIVSVPKAAYAFVAASMAIRMTLKCQSICLQHTHTHTQPRLATICLCL